MDQDNTRTKFSVDVTAEEPAAEQPQSTLKSDLNHKSDQARDLAHNLAHSEDKPKELGGPKGPEPTRFGDWEKRGRCIDF